MVDPSTACDRDLVLSGGGRAGELARSVDWANTPIGPVEGWSHALRSTAALILHNHSGLVLWWGPEFVQIYNDAYTPILAEKHPRAMGQRVRECWTEIWHIIGPMIDSPFRGGPASTSDDLLLPLRRRDFLEEAHFRVAYSPVPDQTVPGTGVGGVLATVTETTEQIYGERQLRTLRELGARSATAESKTAEEACTAAASTLEENAWDVPFALVYLLDERGTHARRVASVGFDRDALETAGPDEMTLDASDSEGSWPIGMVARQRRVAVVDELTRMGVLPHSPWFEQARQAIVLPLASPDQARAYGVLVCGVSPHRALDGGYRAFFELAAGQIVAAIRNARALEEERKHAEALAEIDRAKTAFFSNVSHEFRTPLTLMIAPTEDLLRGVHGELGPSQRAELELLRRNELRLERLVNSLLEFSRIEAGRVQANYAPTDLAALTIDLASSFRAAIERAGLRFLVDCPALAEEIFVDGHMWEQIVLNLLSNAFKFTFEGEIALSLRESSSAVVLEVKDAGVGVPPEEMPRLFERFHRVEGTPARTHEGSGIGLALVQELARLHGGAITAESTEGAGTTFRVTVPKGSEHLPKERICGRAARNGSSLAPVFVSEAWRWLPDESVDAVPESESISHPSEARPTAGLPSAHVLVADDNADMRDYLRRILSQHWSVQTVADGEQALEAAKRRRPDLVLTDVMMPVLDGFRLIKALRENESTRDIPVVMLSARAGEEARVDGLRAGADDYLVKPFSARELVVRIAANLETSRLRRALDAERKRLLSLFENAPAIICAFKGPEHVFELANPHFHRFAGNRQVLGLPARRAYPEVEGQGFIEMLDEVYRTGNLFHAHESRALLDNKGTGELEERYVTYVYQPSRSADGDVDGVLVFGFDVTEHVEARRTLQEERRRAESAQARAESAVRVRDEFLAVASHELRTPLTTLGLQLDGLLRAMHECAGHPEAQRWFGKAKRVREQADRLEQLIETMMDVFTLTSDPAHLSCVDVDLADVVRRAVERLRPNSRHITDAVELSTVPVVGYWDPKRLDQIATQLFSNALKFGAGEAVRVQVDAVDHSARLTVVDRGIGIAVEDRERIFGRFERAAPHDYGGFGLGLWIVRELVSAMGGTVSVDSEPGRGSTFVVELPRSS